MSFVLSFCLFVRPSVCPPARMEKLGSHWTDFHEISYWRIFRIYVEKIQVSLKSDRKPSPLHEYKSTFMIICRWSPLRIRNISVTICRRNHNSRFMRHFPPPWKSYCLLDNVEIYGWARQGTGDKIIRRLRCAYWITMATDTYSEYVILIAFLQQQKLRERVLISCYTDIICFVYVASWVRSVWPKPLLGSL